MFRVDSEKDLLNAFRSRDRKHVELPKGTKLPLTVLDYLSWTDEHNERVFLLFKAPGQTHTTGLVFRKDHQVGQSVRVCEWCHQHGSSDTVGLMSIKQNNRKVIGIYLCLDLSCGVHVEDDANRRGKSARDAMKDLLGKFSRFAEEGLGITQHNRNAAPAP